MPEVKVTHDSLKDPTAKEPPPRDPVAPGNYVALITSAVQGVTKGTPILTKVTVQYQLMHMELEDGALDDTYQGRVVYQDYILEKDPKSNPEMNQRRRYELVQLLEATNTPYTDDGFNTDHLANKTVRVLIRHRPGKQIDPVTNMIPVFANVVKVDTTEAAAAGDLV
jgi:hypothetical protein